VVQEYLVKETTVVMLLEMQTFLEAVLEAAVLMEMVAAV
jgi:hypothetical protein